MLFRRTSPKQTGQLKEKNKRMKVDVKAAIAEEERRWKKLVDDKKKWKEEKEAKTELEKNKNSALGKKQKWSHSKLGT